MQRLRDYFLGAQTCTPATRRFGLESENLFGARHHHDGRIYRPISIGQSQQIMRWMAAIPGWSVAEQKGNLVTKVEGLGFTIVYELGHSNLEVITPTVPVSRSDALIGPLTMVHNMMAKAACPTSEHAVMLAMPYDRWENIDTLVMPDKRDEIWKQLDGPVLTVLGHIASLHINIDLTSIEEGMAWIAQINRIRNEQGWPDADVERIWQRYLLESRAGYEPDRYGPAPETFADYIERLSQLKVVMNTAPDGLQIADPQRPFAACEHVDIEMFLRSVWWGARLRVRDGKLVLEIRDIPRRGDEHIHDDFELLRSELGF